MPAGARIGGVSDQLDSLPALAGRSVIATPEHAIPYHKGYFSQIEVRLQASLAMIASDDPAVLTAYVRRWGITHIAVDRAFVTVGALPRDYARVVPAAAAQAQAAVASRASLVRRYALACAVYAGPSVILADSACLIRKGAAAR